MSFFPYFTMLPFCVFSAFFRRAKDLTRRTNFKRISLMFAKLVFAVFFVFAPFVSYGAIYGYIDDQGVYHMTNIRPPSKGYHILVHDSRVATSYSVKGAFNRSDYDGLIRAHSEAHGIDPSLVKAVMIAESNGNPNAVSNKGARGLMQIMPSTGHLLDLQNPFDPSENIQAGAKYLKQLHELFKGNLELVLAAYNAGPNRVIQNNMAVPAIDETVNYVKRVKYFYNRLKSSP
ncbi:MAG TPA: lytic transglycosylase [Deltaproteobacteria bacterium]|nr:lytic transglycosylase [Deltaproteobacteria bacterium]